MPLIVSLSNKTNKAVRYGNIFIFCSHYYRSKAIGRVEPGRRTFQPGHLPGTPWCSAATEWQATITFHHALSYLPSWRSWPQFGQYQIKPFDNEITCGVNTCKNYMRGNCTEDQSTQFLGRFMLLWIMLPYNQTKAHSTAMVTGYIPELKTLLRMLDISSVHCS